MTPIIDRKLIDKMYTTTIFTDLNVTGANFTANIPITFPIDEIIITQLSYQSAAPLEAGFVYMLACDFPIGTQYIASFIKGTSSQLDTRINMMQQTINQYLNFRVYTNTASANVPAIVNLTGQLALTVTLIKYAHVKL